MSRLGIIGVGEIAGAVVEGLCDGVDPGERPAVCLSPRGAATAQRLARRYPAVTVAASNQAVADQADLLIVSVRPEHLAEALSGVRLRPGTVLISAVAGVDHDALRALAGPDVDVVRAIPLPAVRHRAAITALYPAHAAAARLFGRLGKVLEVDDGHAFSALSAATGVMSTLLAFLRAVSQWTADQGVEARAADRYLRSLFVGLSQGLTDSAMTPDELVTAHETPGGLNQQLRTRWFTAEAGAALHAELDALLRRVSPPPQSGR